MPLKYLPLCFLLLIHSSSAQIGISNPQMYSGAGSQYRTPFTANLYGSASAPPAYGPYGYGYGPPPPPPPMPYHTTTFSSPPQYTTSLAQPFQSSNVNSNSGNNNNNNGGSNGGGRRGLLSRIFPSLGDGESRGLLGLGSNRGGGLLSRLRGNSNNNDQKNNNNNNNNNNQMQQAPVYPYNPYALGAQQLQAQVHMFPPGQHPQSYPHPGYGGYGPPPPPSPPYDGPDDGPDGPPGHGY